MKNHSSKNEVENIKHGFFQSPMSKVRPGRGDGEGQGQAKVAVEKETEPVDNI